MKKLLKSLVMERRSDLDSRYECLPRKAVNAAQQKLLKKHGSPYDFAAKCIKAVGDMISIEEAERVINKYNKACILAAGIFMQT